MNEELKKNIPSGSNYVRFKRQVKDKEYLYVEVKDSVVKILNTLGKEVDNYVYLKKDELDDVYKISLKPFKSSNNNIKKKVK